MVKFGRSKAEQCAKEIIQWLLDHEMWIDTSIYANGKRFSCRDIDGHYHYENTMEQVFVEEKVDPKKYFDYTGDFLCIATEGPFYDVLNFSYENKYYAELEEEFYKICKKYNKYFEMGDSWNLALYSCD